MNEYISKKTARYFLCKLCTEKCDDPDFICEGLNGCEYAQMLDAEPAADVVEVKHGEWLGCMCSECAQIDWTQPNFCPNCGADMRGKDNE